MQRGQGHAGRPERPAGRPCPAGGHHRPVRRLHGQARRVLPRAAGDHRGADRRARPPAGRGPADDGLAQPRAARAAGPADEPGDGRRRPGLPRWPSSSDNLRALRPGLDRESEAGMRPGGESLGYSEAVEAVADLADLEALQAQLSPGRPRCRPSTTSTSTCWSSGSAARRSGDLQALRDLERELEQQGYLTRGDDGLRLTPRAVRRLGQTRAAAGVRPARGHRPRRPRRPPHRGRPTSRPG